MQAARQWLFVFVLTASLMGLGPVQPTLANQREAAARPASALDSNFLELTGPTACPSGGCAGGQRIGMHFGFGLSGISYDANVPNIKVCIYASTKWNSGLDVDNTRNGEISGLPYSTPVNIPEDSCPKDGNAPPGFKPILESVATLPPGQPSDALRFAFRFGASGSDPDGPNAGQVVAYLYTHTTSGWSPMPAVSSISPILTMARPATANAVYVANDGPTCGIYSPCYINSDGDKSNGIGTGLKDAVDISSGSSPVINIIGSYPVKGETVKIGKKLTLTGINDATITYTGPTNSCSDAAVLSLDAPVRLTGLNIDSGNCGNVRHLIEINSNTGTGDAVTVESNDISNGNNAIVIKAGNTDKTTIRFNQITGNSGHAIFFEGSDTSTSAAEITANNITGNQFPINCAGGLTTNAVVGNRKANHNYWGGDAPTQGDTHCKIDPAKRLGMPIAHNPGSPGVHAGLVPVKGEKERNDAKDFGNQLAFKRTGGNDFDIYVVDHGYMTAGGPPFTQKGESPSPCSNYWDIFLPDGTTPPTTLDLFIKYYNKENKTPGCLTVINSTQYCDQTSQAKYPLFWLDPSSNSVTKWWDQVGAKPENMDTGDGQTTACNISANEIQVSINNATNKRPNLFDLGYTPFMVGIPVIKYFTPLASSQLVTVTWATNNEPDISGFNILRGLDENNLVQINGDLIPRLGTSTYGSTYSKTDSGKVNGTKYYYRLQVVRTDGYSFYSAITSVIVNAATPTSPPPTWTASPVRPTSTSQFTVVPTNRPTQIPTKSITPAKTWTPGPTSLILPTLTSTINVLTPGAYDTLTAIAATSGFLEGSGTPTTGAAGANLTITPDKTPGTAVAFLGSTTPSPRSKSTLIGAVAGESTKTNPWLSLLLGLLAGLVVVGGAGRWWYSIRK